MKTFWIIVSVVCGAAAVVFVIRDDYDKAFIAAALGAVAWFLNYRAQLVRNRVTTDDTDENDEEEDQL